MKHKVNFSRHSKRQMKWREITEKEVENAVLRPDELVESEIENRKIALKHVGDKYLKVIYTKENDNIIIITVIDKSK